MKLKIALALALLALTGCSSTNITELTKALAKDPATVHMRVVSIYGTVDFVRVGTTNGTTIAPDGTITTK